MVDTWRTPQLLEDLLRAGKIGATGLGVAGSTLYDPTAAAIEYATGIKTPRVMGTNLGAFQDALTGRPLGSGTSLPIPVQPSGKKAESKQGPTPTAGSKGTSYLNNLEDQSLQAIGKTRKAAEGIAKNDYTARFKTEGQDFNKREGLVQEAHKAGRVFSNADVNTLYPRPEGAAEAGVPIPEQRGAGVPLSMPRLDLSRGIGGLVDFMKQALPIAATIGQQKARERDRKQMLDYVNTVSQLNLSKAQIKEAAARMPLYGAQTRLAEAQARAEIPWRDKLEAEYGKSILNLRGDVLKATAGPLTEGAFSPLGLPENMATSREMWDKVVGPVLGQGGTEPSYAEGEEVQGEFGTYVFRNGKWEKK